MKLSSCESPSIVLYNENPHICAERGTSCDILSKRTVLALFVVTFHQLAFFFPEYFTRSWIYQLNIFLDATRTVDLITETSTIDCVPPFQANQIFFFQKMKRITLFINYCYIKCDDTCNIFDISILLFSLNFLALDSISPVTGSQIWTLKDMSLRKKFYIQIQIINYAGKNSFLSLVTDTCQEIHV